MSLGNETQGYIKFHFPYLRVGMGELIPHVCSATQVKCTMSQDMEIFLWFAFRLVDKGGAWVRLGNLPFFFFKSV